MLKSSQLVVMLLSNIILNSKHSHNVVCIYIKQSKLTLLSKVSIYLVETTLLWETAI